MEYLAKVVHRTPLTMSNSINQLTGKQVYFKMENQQKTGSFKIRGAAYKLSRLHDSEAKQGVIAASAGNHAQGVALAAANRGIQAKLFMPERTPLAKVEATRSYGASTVLIGESFQEAYEAARLEQNKYNATLVHPFDDYDVMAGQGTIAMEMLQQQPSLDTILVPVGGGGLLAGMAVAVKSIDPSIRVIGVQVDNANALYNQFHGNEQSKFQDRSTIAEGIAVKKPGNLTFPLIHKYVDDMITVSDRSIANAMLYMLQREKTLIEGAGAASFAALLVHGQRIRSNHCGIVVSGGNMDIAKLHQIQQMAKKDERCFIPA